MRFKETRDRRPSQEAILPNVSLSLLQRETLEVFLNSDRQLLAGEGFAKVLFRPKDARSLVG